MCALVHASTTITLGAFSPDTRNNAAAGDVSELLAPTAGPMAAEQQRTIFNFSDHNFLLHEFWDLAEIAAQPADALCIPKHPGASPLAHALLPSGWAFLAVLDEQKEVKAEDLVALATALPAAAGPLRLVWCVPQRLWAGFTARRILPAGSGAAVAGGGSGGTFDVGQVQQYALEVRVRQKCADGQGQEWV